MASLAQRTIKDIFRPMVRKSRDRRSVRRSQARLKRPFASLTGSFRTEMAKAGATM